MEVMCDVRYSEQPPHVLRRLRIANGLAEHCISPAQGGREDHGTDSTAALQLRRLAHACGLPEFLAAIRKRDKLPELLAAHGRKIDEEGHLDEELLDLAWQLLRWHPSERISSRSALNHPALKVPTKETFTTDVELSYTKGMDIEELNRLTRPACDMPDGAVTQELKQMVLASSLPKKSVGNACGDARSPLTRLPAVQERSLSRWQVFDWAKLLKRSK